MDNQLQSIKGLILEIHNCICSERYYQTTQALCLDFDYAEQEFKRYRIHRKQLIKQLIKQLNNYINYPISKFLIFRSKKQVKYHEEKDWNNNFIGYIIEIPQIHKKEYYCIKKLFDGFSSGTLRRYCGDFILS